jgi:hypothetical protein
VEDGLAAGAAIENVVDDAGEIDGKSAGHGVGLAGKTRCLAIREADTIPELSHKLAELLICRTEDRQTRIEV